MGSRFSAIGRSVVAIHLGIALSFAAYLFMVGANSALFGYNYWNEPPPSGVSDAFAVLSLIAWIAFVSAVAALEYASVCLSVADHMQSLGVVVRRAARSLRGWLPVAAISMAVTAIGMFAFLPAVLLAAALGATPFAADNLALRSYGRFVRERFGALVGLSLMTVGSAAVLTVATATGSFWLIDRFDGPVEALSLAACWVLISLIGVVVGVAAHDFHRIYGSWAGQASP